MGPVMNYTKAHSLWEIWMVQEGGGASSSDKLPSLPVSSCSFLSSVLSGGGGGEGRGNYFVRWKLFCLRKYKKPLQMVGASGLEAD